MRIWVIVLLVACSPRVDGPVEQQRQVDRADADRLTAQLRALPGVVRVEATLRRATRDPLSMSAPSVPSLSVVVIVDDKSDRVTTTATSRTLARATAPEIEPTIVVELGAVRPVLVSVGPFTVEDSSKGPLKAALAIALIVIVLLAGWIAMRERRQRRGISAQ